MNAPKAWPPSSDGIAGPLNPFGKAPPSPNAKDDDIPGYRKRFGAYHTLTEGVFLPAGTLLPGGANFAMSATVDFPLHFPSGTKVPGGFLLPASVKKAPAEQSKKDPEINPLCVIQ